MLPEQTPHRQTLTLNDVTYETTFTRKFAARKPHVPKDPKRLSAIIPGLILQVAIVPGQAVRRGDILLVLEAMKMQNHIGALDDGVVQSVHVVPGQNVARGQLLVCFG